MGGDCGLHINQDVCSLGLLTFELKQVHPVEEHYCNSVSWYFRKCNLPRSAASLEKSLGLVLNSSSCLFLFLSGLSYTKMYLYIDFAEPCTVVVKRISTIVQDCLKEKQQKHATETTRYCKFSVKSVQLFFSLLKGDFSIILFCIYMDLFFIIDFIERIMF